MKARNPSTGTLDTVYVKALDSMPVGTQIEFTGDTIPTGWEEVNDYSTDEIDTGKKWIDGKKIYRKVVQGQTPIIASGSGTTNFNIPHNITNFETLVDIDGYMTFNNIPTPLPIYASSGNLMAIYQVNDTNIICRNRNESWSANYPLTFIIEYTKTTD